MTVDERIGQYVTRLAANEAALTKPHVVESVIADEPVTRCGRRLAKRDGTTLDYEDVPNREPCKRCVP